MQNTYPAKVGLDVKASAVLGLVFQPHPAIRAGHHSVAGRGALHAHLLDGGKHTLDLLWRHLVPLVVRGHQDVVCGDGEEVVVFRSIFRSRAVSLYLASTGARKTLMATTWVSSTVPSKAMR
jgi:hypothetical protein